MNTKFQQHHFPRVKGKHRATRYALAVFCLMAVAVLVFKSQTRQKADIEKPLVPEAYPVEASVSIGGAEAETWELHASAGQGAAQTNREPVGVTTIISELGKTYRPGGLPARIRLQSELDERWRTNPPMASEIADLIKDESAPAEVRVYFGKAFRNRIKSRAFEEVDLTEALAEVRAVLRDESQRGMFRAELAMALTPVDQADDTVSAVASLLTRTNDEQSLRAVSALASTTNSLAQDVLVQFVQDTTISSERPNKAVLAALAPLVSTKPEIALPVLGRLAQQTSDLTEFAAALGCLGRARSSEQVMEVLADAVKSKSRFQTHDNLSEQACRSALKHHLAYFSQNKKRLSSESVSVLEELMNRETKK